ncbi:MAG: hypothetical protein V3T14_00070 [Myxococcota bacterium]
MGRAATKAEAIPDARPAPTTTLLDLVAVVASVSDSDAEVVATVQHLINSGRIRLVGHFTGADVKVG